MNIQSLQSNEFNLVIEYFDKEKNKSITTEDILTAIKPICLEYYFIRHYADLNENGELKHDHYHLIIKLPKRIRKSTLIRVLASQLNINDNLITADILYNKRMSVRYLIHLDDPNKYQYSECQIFTNNDEALFNYLHYDIENLDTDRLIDVVIKCNFNKIEIMRVLGLKIYNQYWRMIDIILRELGIE